MGLKDDLLEYGFNYRNPQKESERLRIRSVAPFDDIARAMNFIGYGLEGKFISPPQPVMWETRIKDCLMTCKVLKTLCATYNQSMYHYIYVSSFFYKPTTFAIKYNSTTYTFEITTGMKFKSGQSQIKNKNIDELYKKTELLLIDLLFTMRRELPSARYDELLTRYEIIKSDRS